MSKVKFKELTFGDRFVFLEQLFTKIDKNVARKHSQSSIDLKEKSFGYIGDSFLSFDDEDLVQYVPVNFQKE